MRSKSAPFDNFAEFYKRGPHSAFKQKHREVPGIPLRLVQVQQSSHTLTDAATPDHVLGATLAGQARTHWSWGGKWNTLNRREHGHIGVSPALTVGHFDVEGPHRLLLLAWPEKWATSFLDRVGMPANGDLGFAHDQYLRDPLAFSLILELWRDATDEHLGGTLYTEQLLQTLILRLTSHSRPWIQKRDVRILSKQQQMRLNKWVDEHLERPILIHELAMVVGMNDTQFIRTCRLSTGDTPHQFVIRKRVERAERLLGGSTLSLVEVALACGFSHQSHLNRVFLRIKGMTPNQFRCRCDNALRGA
jgi:AraC family transcriptional regulator